MLKKIFAALLPCLCCCCAYAQNIIKGTVTDAKSGETLIGATVVIKGTQQGAATDVNGKFSISTNISSLPITIVTSFVGYVNKETIVDDFAKEYSIKVGQNDVVLKDVTITGSRISEKIKENALTIEAMDYLAIKETPAANFYEGLGQLKGVDLTSASIGFKIINTRGFNSTSPVRSLQIIDGVDNASPGLNFSLGNFLGCAEIDVNKVELVVGASSAYYGPNAFNGVISMTTRDPFLNTGFEISTKIGERNLNETAWRLAQKFKNKNNVDKFAYKFTFCNLKVDDWKADNYSPTDQSLNNEKNLGGYDAVNIYGDEFINGTDYSKEPGFYPGLGAIYRKGYAETDLVDYKTTNLKLGGALHYRVTPETEIIYASNYGTGSTIYQGDNRYSLKDIKFYQNRLEVRQKDKWFLRGYYTNEDAGKSYDAFFTGLILQRASKDDNDWVLDYVNFWVENVKNNLFALDGFPDPPPPGSPIQLYADYQNSINPFLYNNYPDTLEYYHAIALNFVNGIGDPLNENTPFLQPGTPQFDSAFASITSRKTFGEGGSRFFDKSALYHIHGEYKFTPAFSEITIGGNYRKYLPQSEGTIFSDTNGRKITNEEFGVYAGIEKKFLDDKLKVNFTARLDKNQNFPYLLSPAAGAVYNITKDHIVRGSFSSAIRNPTLADQYLYYQVGRAILVGNKDGYEGLVTIPSLRNYYDRLNFDTLSFFNVAAVRPEEVKTVELGYRATITNKFYIDVGAYYSWYKYFIGYKLGADVDTFTTTLPFNPPYKDIYFNNVLRIATNSQEKVTTNGMAIGLNYYLGKYFAVNCNYSYNILDRHGSTDPLIPAFNTPEHKYNVGFSVRNYKNFGFNINYKWVQGFNYEGSPQFTGYIDDYDMVDAQINYRFEEKLTFKLGASNILNNEHYEVYGGPQVGRLTYFSILLELKNLFD